MLYRAVSIQSEGVRISKVSGCIRLPYSGGAYQIVSDCIIVCAYGVFVLRSYHIVSAPYQKVTFDTVILVIPGLPQDCGITPKNLYHRYHGVLDTK